VSTAVVELPALTETIAPATPETARSTSRRWLGLFAILAATIMNLLDSTVVNIAAPSIRADLGGSFTSLQWIAASYTLALAVGLFTGGRLGDMYGRKPVLLVGIVGFVVASLACGFAWSPESLLAARVLQGGFAAVMIPQGFGLIRDMFPPSEIGKAFGAFGPVIGLATILGPIVAGALIEADLAGSGWRTIFLINLPLGAFALVAGRRALPEPTRTGTRTPLDLVGTVLAAAAMFLVVFPLVQGRELGWPAWTFALLAASVPVVALFVRHQLRRARTGRTPLVELSVLARRSYASGVVFVVVFFGVVVGFSLAVGMFLQLGLGYSAMRASLTMAAWALGAFVGTVFGATTMARLGRTILHIGLGTMAVAVAGMYGVLRLAGTGVGSAELVGPLLLFGIGMGMIFVPLFDIIMGEVRDHEVGSAAGILESIQQLGASLGVAVLGTIFFAAIEAPAAIGTPGVASRAAHLARSVHAVEVTTLLTLALTAVAFGLAYLLPRKARAGH
jgi:EmrB/QacA subfamily drug resistance transporter